MCASDLSLSELEPRQLLFAFTPQEVYLSELINRARADPYAEAVRLNLPLTSGLSTGDANQFGVKEPLALLGSLTTSARAHALDMATRNFFGHVSPSPTNKNATNRGNDAGFAGTVGENLASQLPDLDAVYFRWLENPVQRANILSLYQYFNSTYHYDRLGIGISAGVAGSAYSSYYVADFGNPAPGTRATTLLGVIFDDQNNNDFYTIGEGLAGVRVDVASTASPSTVLASSTTDAAGNYQFDLAPGTYTVTFTQLSTGALITKQATITNQNVRVAAELSELRVPVPPPPPDDHADANRWGQATIIATDPTTGHGVAAGRIGVAGDSDLFAFKAGKTGLTTISALRSTGTGFATQITLFSIQGLPLATGTATGTGSGDSSIPVSLVQDQWYYVLVAARDSVATGTYALTIQGPTVTAVDPSVESTLIDGQSLSTALANGKTTLAFVNALGHPVFAERSTDGVWTRTDLLNAAGGSTVIGEPTVFVDPKDGLTYVAVSTTQGLALYRRASDSSWSVRNLSALFPWARSIVSNLAFTFDSANRVQISGIADNGDLVSYWQNSRTVAGDWVFRFFNISARQLRPANIQTPALAGRIDSWQNADGGVSLAYLDTTGKVQLFSRSRQGIFNQVWSLSNLSNITGAPALVGTIQGASVSGKTTITGLDASGNTWYIDQRLNGRFRATNITLAYAGSTTPLAGGITGFVQQANQAFVVGITSSGQVALSRYTYTGAIASWQFSIAGPLLESVQGLRPVNVSFDPASGELIIFGVKPSGEIVSLTGSVSSSWTGSWTLESVSVALST